jgi:excisionase family DNA binding protein
MLETEAGKPFVFTRAEAARELRISTKSLDRAIRRGELRTRRIGSRVLITQKALQEFVGDRTAPRRHPHRPGWESEPNSIQ